MLGETILSFLGRPIFRSKLAVSFSFRVYPKNSDTHGTHGSGIFVSPCLNSYTGESSQTRLWKSTKQRQREPPQALCRQINVPPRSPVIPFTTCSIWRRLCHSMLPTRTTCLQTTAKPWHVSQLKNHPQWQIYQRHPEGSGCSHLRQVVPRCIHGGPQFFPNTSMNLYNILYII